MISHESPIHFSDPLPAEVDVVVVGAGVIGVSTAWFLRERGVSVVLLEKGRVAGEQSSRNWGWIRQHGRDPAELPIVTESIRHWEAISASVDEDIGFARHGVLYLASNDGELERLEQWLAVAKIYDVDTRMLDRTGLSKVIRDTGRRWIGGAYTASDARAEPFLAVPAMARALHKGGVAIVENCAARVVELTDGKVAGVVTERGTVRCRQVVCCAGAWASLFCRPLGGEFPQLTVRATVARTAAAPDFFAGNAASHRIAFRRRQDGGYTLAASGLFDHFVGRDSFRYFRPFIPNMIRSRRTYSLRFRDGLINRLRHVAPWDGDSISPFERTRVLNPQPSEAAVREISRVIADELPELSGIEILQSWAGMIDATPDVVPVMDQVPGVTGCFVAAGFSGHGFGIGPGAGRVMADLMLGNDIGHDITRFRHARFTDGSTLKLGPAI